jgi:hypothetical protein
MGRAHLLRMHAATGSRAQPENLLAQCVELAFIGPQPEIASERVEPNVIKRTTMSHNAR